VESRERVDTSMKFVRPEGQLGMNALTKAGRIEQHGADQ
jgi:hypothetical protein